MSNEDKTKMSKIEVFYWIWKKGEGEYGVVASNDQCTCIASILTLSSKDQRFTATKVKVCCKTGHG